MNKESEALLLQGAGELGLDLGAVAEYASGHAWCLQPEVLSVP